MAPEDTADREGVGDGMSGGVPCRPTLDLLVVTEPADGGGGLAPGRRAGEGNHVPLHGRFGEADDLRPLGDTYGTPNAQASASSKHPLKHGSRQSPACDH